jgi:hypothetical protein
MSNETTENFLKVMAEFAWPEPKPIFYRLYYNDDGSPNCYAMEDLPGKYIEVDQETYIKHLWNVRVVDNKLTIIPIRKKVQKLKPSAHQGVACCSKDICIVVDPTQPHTKWNISENEID